MLNQHYIINSFLGGGGVCFHHIDYSQTFTDNYNNIITKYDPCRISHLLHWTVNIWGLICCFLSDMDALDLSQIWKERIKKKKKDILIFSINVSNSCWIMACMLDLLCCCSRGSVGIWRLLSVVRVHHVGTSRSCRSRLALSQRELAIRLWWKS